MSEPAPADHPPTGRRCPRCGRPTVWQFRPFCSAGCRDRDLLDWLEGRYALPAVEAQDPEEGEGEPSADGPALDRHGPRGAGFGRS